MTTILVGSANPVKLDATRRAFALYFEHAKIKGLNVESGVPDQPIGDETFTGARNRADALRQLDKADELDADFFVGIEGGLINTSDIWFSLGCMCIIDRWGKISFGTSPHFELPPRVTRELLDGVELGDVMDRLVDGHNTKQKQGAIGILSQGKLDRTNLYLSGLICALLPFVNKELYSQ